jgi:hypothetical protein
MLATQAIEDLPRGLHAAGLHVPQAALDTLDGLHSVEEGLVGVRILDHEFRPAVDRQDKRVPGLSETLQQIGRIPFEITQRSNVIGQIKHSHASLNSHHI